MSESLGPTVINPNHEHTFGVVFGGFDGDEVSFRACRCGHYPVVAPLVFPQPESRAVELLRELVVCIERLDHMGWQGNQPYEAAASFLKESGAVPASGEGRDSE